MRNEECVTDDYCGECGEDRAACVCARLDCDLLCFECGLYECECDDSDEPDDEDR